MLCLRSGKPRLVATGITLIAFGVLALGCSQSAPAPAAAPTKAPAPAAAPAQPTVAPAKPTAAPAVSSPTKAPAPATVTYPTKPITVIAPFAAGGALDVGARLMGSYLEKELGQPIQVVNKAGASGQVGMTEVAQAKPDGYTLGIPGHPTHEANYLDPERKSAYNRSSFAPIANQVIDPNTFAVRADSPYKTLADLIAAAKEKPNSIVAGDSGLMTDDHQALLSLQKLTGTQFSVTHFTGGALAQQALHGGHIVLMVGNIGDVLTASKAGQFRVLGLASENRSDLLPDVKTFKEQGFDLVAGVWRGWLAPKGTPPEVVKILEAAMKKVDSNAEYRQKMASSGLPVSFVSGVDYDKYLQATETRVADLLKDLPKQP